MAVKDDIRAGERLTETDDGYTHTRTFDVENLTGASNALLFKALESGGLPRLNDNHPVIPNLKVTFREATPMGKGVARVTIQYSKIKPPDSSSEPVTQLTSTVAPKKTIRNKDGEFLSVSYNGFAQIATAEIGAPEIVISKERRELEKPDLKALQFVGSVNKITIGSYAPRTLLCTRIQAVSVDDDPLETDEGFDVIYEFQYNPDTWDVLIAYTDEFTGKHPPDMEVNVGFKFERVYPETDFSQLNLSL